MSKQWCSGPENGLPYPDAIYFLDIDPKLIKQRGGYGAEKYETDAMQSRVREMFEEIRDHTWMVRKQQKTKFIFFVYVYLLKNRFLMQTKQLNLFTESCSNNPSKPWLKFLKQKSN